MDKVLENSKDILNKLAGDFEKRNLDALIQSGKVKIINNDEM